MKSSFFEAKLEKLEEERKLEELSKLPQEPLEEKVEIERTVVDDYIDFKNGVADVLAEIPDHELDKLYHKFKHEENKVALAVDAYFRSKENAPHKTIPAILLENNPKRKRTRGVQLPFTYPKKSRATLNDTKAPQGWKKYLGTVYADAFTTRPIFQPLKSGQKLGIKSLKPNTLIGKEKKKRADIAVIRLYTLEGGEREFGRIKEDLTRLLTPLIDYNCLDCEVTVAADSNTRIGIGENFYIKLDCYLTNEAFAKQETTTDDLLLLKKSKKLNFNPTTETEAETILRLRQKAVSQLFARLQVRAVRLKDDKEILATQAEPTQVENIEESDEEHNDTLTLDQLQSFYSDNQQSEMLKALPSTTIPPEENFGMELRPYQRHGLSWMLVREKELDILKTLNNETVDTADIQQIEEGVMNPLWKTFKWPQQDEIAELGAEDGIGKYFYGNMFSGELSLEKPLIKTTVKGGVLADEMGLGKTISALSLINSVPYDLKSSFEGDNYASQTTLVIVPMSLLSPWKQEFDRANKNINHKCIVYYGQQNVADLKSLLVNKKKHIPIMIVTTYGTVQSEYSKIESRRDKNGLLPKTGLYSVKFFRIIIDEGHQIRNRTNKTSRAVFELQLSRKWVLTGTPIINRLDDLYAIVKFLELEPWDNFSYWKMFITMPFEQKQIKQTLDVVKTILEPVFLRRTKAMKDENGVPLVELPSKEVVIENVKFSDRERRLYDWFKDKAYRQFTEGLNSGQLLKKYTQILTQILRLRQLCCHPDLIKGEFPDMDEDVDQLDKLGAEELAKLKEAFTEEGDKFDTKHDMNQVKYGLYDKITPDAECSICTEPNIALTKMVVTECGHMFCFSCLIEHLDFQNSSNQKINSCPNCRNKISRYKLFRVRNKPTTKNEVRFITGEEGKDYPFGLYLYDPTRASSKIQALINHILQLKDQKLLEPVIVFSQFSSYLDLISSELKVQLDDVRCLKFDGTLSEVQRQNVLAEFRKSDEHTSLTVLLISLKAGGVGLNLTTASRAFMMDPWWSPSIEEQAIDRIHRIGQNKTVKVVRFIVDNSIELNMLRIQERKKQLGEIVGLEEEEKRRRRVEEIQMLFDE